MCACLRSANVKHNCSATVEQEQCYTVRLRCAPPATTNDVLIAMFTVPWALPPAGKLSKVGILCWLNVLVKFTNSYALASDAYLAYLEAGSWDWLAFS